MRHFVVFFFLFSFQYCHAQTDSFFVSNTFTDSTKVYFSLPDSERVLIRIYNRWGTNVETVFNDSFISAGSHTGFIPSDNLTPGTYIAVFIFGNKQITQQILKESTATGTTAMPNRRPVRCSPNPTKDLLNIPVSGFKNIYILTLSGQVAKYITSNANSISLADLPMGNYSVLVSAGDGKTLMSDYVMVMK
jgi:hypothetical protein